MCILLFGCTDMFVRSAFYASARVPASVVHHVCLLETCNERKEDVGQRVSRKVLRTSREVNRACALRARAHFVTTFGGSVLR
jgi:hypothetical protein